METMREEEIRQKMFDNNLSLYEKGGKLSYPKDGEQEYIVRYIGKDRMHLRGKMRGETKTWVCGKSREDVEHQTRAFEDFGELISIKPSGNFGTLNQCETEKEYSVKKEGGRLSPAKQILQSRINKLEAARAKIKSDKVKREINMKIGELQERIDYKPTSKQRILNNKKRYALDIPTQYRNRVYKKLWDMNILSRTHKMQGTTSIILTGNANLNKAYKIYSDMLQQEGKKAPGLSTISREL